MCQVSEALGTSLKNAGWECTDMQTMQCSRKIAKGRYVFIQADAEDGVVRMKSYDLNKTDKGQLNAAVLGYYDSVDELKTKNPDNWEMEALGMMFMQETFHTADRYEYVSDKEEASRIILKYMLSFIEGGEYHYNMKQGNTPATCRILKRTDKYVSYMQFFTNYRGEQIGQLRKSKIRLTDEGVEYITVQPSRVKPVYMFAI